MAMKRPHAGIYLRVPLDVKSWLKRQTERAFTSQNAEIVRSIKERMDRERVEARSQRAAERA